MSVLNFNEYCLYEIVIEARYMRMWKDWGDK